MASLNSNCARLGAPARPQQFNCDRTLAVQRACVEFGRRPTDRVATPRVQRPSFEWSGTPQATLHLCLASHASMLGCDISLMRVSWRHTTSHPLSLASCMIASNRDSSWAVLRLHVANLYVAGPMRSTRWHPPPIGWIRVMGAHTGPAYADRSKGCIGSVKKY